MTSVDLKIGFRLLERIKATLFIFVQTKRSFHLVRDEKAISIKWKVVQKKVFVINDPGVIVAMIFTSEGADVHDEWVMV